MLLSFFKKYNINIDTHSYKYMCVYPIIISTYERLNRLDFKIHEVGHQECLTVDGMSSFIERIINRKCNIHVKSKI
jgi:hypothetical protein